MRHPSKPSLLALPLIAILQQTVIAQSWDQRIVFQATVRDFPVIHPDFEPRLPINLDGVCGILENDMDSFNDVPVFKPYYNFTGIPGYENDPTLTSLPNYRSTLFTKCALPYSGGSRQQLAQTLAFDFHGQFFFDEWYWNTPGINVAMSNSFVFNYVAASNGEYSYANTTYFPISNDKGFAIELQNSKPFGFTTEFRLEFYYRGGETFDFYGDDDLWVFIDKKRTECDLGGIHPAQNCRISLDSLGFAPNTVHEMVIFHAERHTTESRLQITTSVLPINTPPLTPDMTVTGTENVQTEFLLRAYDDDYRDFVKYCAIFSYDPFQVPESYPTLYGNMVLPDNAGLGEWFDCRGKVTYVPPTDVSAYTDTFYYIAQDSKGMNCTKSGVVSIYVTSVDTLPVAYSANLNATQYSNINLQLNASDIDTPLSSLYFRLISVPQLGSAKLNASGYLTYLPDTPGTEVLIFVVNDRFQAASSTAATIASSINNTNTNNPARRLSKRHFILPRDLSKSHTSHPRQHTKHHQQHEANSNRLSKRSITPPPGYVRIDGDSNLAAVTITIAEFVRPTILPTNDPTSEQPQQGLTPGQLAGVVAGSVVGFVVLAVIAASVVYYNYAAKKFEAMWEAQFRAANMQMNPMYQGATREAFNPLYQGK